MERELNIKIIVKKTKILVCNRENNISKNKNKVEER